MSLNWITQGSPEFDAQGSYTMSDSSDGYSNSLSNYYDWNAQRPFLESLGYTDQNAFTSDMSESGGGVPYLNPEVLERLTKDGYSIGALPVEGGVYTSILQNNKEVSPSFRNANTYDEGPGWNLATGLASAAIMPGGLVTGAGGGLGGGLGLSGSTAQGVNAAFNSGMMGFGSGAEDRDVVTGMALSGGAPFLPNIGEMAGIENPYLANSFDGAIKGGAIADLTGGDVKTGGILGGLPGLSSYLGARFMDTSYLPTSSGQNLINETNQASMLPKRGFSLDSMVNASPVPDYVPQNSPLAFNAPSSNSSFELPALNEFFGKLMPSSPQGWGNLAEGLGGLLMGGLQYRKSRKLEKEMGARRGAYETNLRRQLERRDAASGRRSNYSGRETALQASLAELDSRNMPARTALNNNQIQGLAGMFTSGLRYAGKQGVFGDQYMPGYNQPSQSPVSSYLMSTIPMSADVSNFDQFIGGTRFGDQNQRRFKLGGM